MSVKTVAKHERGVSSLILAEDGESVLSAGDGFNKDKTSIITWVVKTGNMTSEIEKAHIGAITAMILSRAQDYIISCGHDRTIKIWDYKTKKCSCVLKTRKNIPFCLAISKKDKYLVAGFNDGSLSLFKMKDKSLVLNTKLSNSGVFSLSYLSDEKKLLCGMGDGTIFLVKYNKDRKNFDILEKFKEHEGSVWSLKISPQEEIFASGSDDKTIKIWHLESKKVLKILQGHPGRINALEFSTDGRYIISAGAGYSKLDPNYDPESNDYAIRAWSSFTGELLGKFIGHTGEVRSLVLTTDGKTLVSGSSSIYKNAGLEQNSIKFWDFENKVIVEKKIVPLYKCINCGEELTNIGGKFCPMCGSDILKNVQESLKEYKPRECKYCGIPLKEDAETCQRCGTPTSD